MVYTSVKLSNIFKLIKLFPAMGPEDPKSFICLLADLSVPGNAAVLISLLLNYDRGPNEVS